MNRDLLTWLSTVPSDVVDWVVEAPEQGFSWLISAPFLALLNAVRMMPANGSDPDAMISFWINVMADSPSIPAWLQRMPDAMFVWWERTPSSLWPWLRQCPALGG